MAVLQAVQPLIRIQDSEQSMERMGRRNKFCGGLMRADTLSFAMDILSDHLTATKLIYDKAKSKGNLRPYHLSLIDMFAAVSTPSAQDICDLEAQFRWNRDEVGLKDLAAFQQMLGELRVEHEGFNLELQIDAEKDVPEEEEDLAVLDGASSQDVDNSESCISSDSVDSTQIGFHADHQAAPDMNELNLPATVRTDIKCRTYKESAFGNSKVKNLDGDRTRTEFCSFIAECKKDEDDCALFQNAGHACIEMKQNIQNGHYDPMYLPVLAQHSYTYAILSAHAMVEIRGGKIDYDAYQELCAAIGVECETEAELKRRLNTGREELLRWTDLKCKDYEDGWYLVGSFHVHNKWYSLPGVSSSGAINFFEAMMRIVVGDSVLDWTMADVYKAVRNRKMFLQMKRRADGNTRQDREAYLRELSGAELLAKADRCFEKFRRVLSMVGNCQEVLELFIGGFEKC